MAMNYEYNFPFNDNNSNNDTTSESETIDEIPRFNSIGSFDGTNNSSNNSRRVSFPKSDSDLVTGYLEPANPWESAAEVKNINEIIELYEESCKKHNTKPLEIVLDHIRSLELRRTERQTSFNLKNTQLTPESCEALEEIFKRVQYEVIDLSDCNLNDIAGSALFDMIEYYEAAAELDISNNSDISTRGWQSCISMIKRSRALQILIARGIALSELNAANLGKSLNQSCLHTIKLEHCGLTGRPLASLCNSLRKNTTLKELWIAYNDLSDIDAEKLADLLKANAYLEFLDISNNHINDTGVKHIAIALIEQSTNLQSLKEYELNSVLNVHNNNNNNNNNYNNNTNESCEKNSSSLAKFCNENDNIINDNNTDTKCSPVKEVSNDDEFDFDINSFKDDISPLSPQLLPQQQFLQQNENHCNTSDIIEKNSCSNNNNNTNNNNIIAGGGRSMLDTLLNMNSSSLKDNSNLCKSNLVEQKQEITTSTPNKNENEILIDFSTTAISTTKNSQQEICNLLNLTRLDCLIPEIVNIDENKKILSPSVETSTLPLSIDSSFGDEKSTTTIIPSSEFLVSQNNDNKNDNLLQLSYNENQNENLLSSPLSLNQITTNTLDLNENENDVNKNSMIEEFDSNSSDSAFESASESDTTKILIDKNNYIRTPSPHPLKQQQQQEQQDCCNKHSEQNEIQEVSNNKDQQQQHPQIQSEYNTKEPTKISCNILINNEIGATIISSSIRNRSLSSDSLSSDNSIDSSLENSSIISTKMNEKLTKNDTLTRQKHSDDLLISTKKPRGLQALILWNNDITRDSGEYISDLLYSTTSLELLNVGKNILSNEFLNQIKSSLQRNTSVSNLGLQSTHLNSEGIKILGEVLQFGGNNALQRIDIRDNNIQVEGLAALADALKSNNTVTRIDIDDVPKRIPEDGNDTQFHYSRMLHNVRSLCSRNQRSQEMPTSCSNVKISRHYMSSRKISLTCQSLRSPIPDIATKNELGISETVRKRSGTRLRSPLPSPPTISPSSSPVPSPSRNRFQVFRVIEKTSSTNQHSPDEIKNIGNIEQPSQISIPPPPPPPVVKETQRKRLSRFKVTMVESSPLVSTIQMEDQKKNNDINNTINNIEHKTELSTDIITNKENEEANENKNILQNIADLSIKISPLPLISKCDAEIQTIDEINIEENNKQNHRIKENVIKNESLNDELKALEEKQTEAKNETVECLSVEQTKENLSGGQISEKHNQKQQQQQQQHEYDEKLDVQINEQEIENISPLKETSLNISNEILKPPDTSENTRTRRVSWITTGNYPTTVDKLLNLFQNPGNIFSRSSSPENNDTNSKKIEDTEMSSSQSLMPLRKQSPPGLFQWNKTQNNSSEIKRISSDNMISSNLQSYVRGIADFGKQVFKQNVPFIDNSTISAVSDQQQQDCKSIPSNIKMEIKENISPEHTVTKNTIVSFQPVSPAQEMTDISLIISQPNEIIKENQDNNLQKINTELKESGNYDVSNKHQLLELQLKQQQKLFSDATTNPTITTTTITTTTTSTISTLSDVGSEKH